MKKISVEIEKTGEKMKGLEFSGRTVAELLQQLQMNIEDCIVAVNGEIVTCPDCGLEFELSIDEHGKCSLKIAEVVGEDWGE